MEKLDPMYNIEFVSKLRDSDDNVYEKMKIMNAIDKRISGYSTHCLAHIVPILYSFVVMSGISVFIYKIIG